MGPIRLKSSIICLLASLGFWFTTCPAAAADASGRNGLPFKPGERITYDVLWMGIIGGEGILRVSKQITYNGHQVYVIESTGRSIGFLRKLYKIEDHTSSYFDINRLFSHRVEIKISEGNYRKLKIIEFDQDRHIATYKIDDGEAEQFEIEPNSLDSLTVLYALRTMRDKIIVGEKLYIPLFDDKKKYELEIRVLRRERLSLKQGMVDTIVVEPQLKTEGIFQRRGKMTLWLTDDENLIPVAVRSRVLIGSFYATLRDYEGVEINFIPDEKPGGKK